MKRTKINEILGYNQEDSEPKSTPKGSITKPMITAHLAEAFDKFREGMDVLTNVYILMSGVDAETHRKVSRFGEAMSNMLVGFAKLIEEQGGSIETTTKPQGLQKYLSKKNADALGLNEDKEAVFKARFDNNVNKIKSIIYKK